MSEIDSGSSGNVTEDFGMYSKILGPAYSTSIGLGNS